MILKCNNKRCRYSWDYGGMLPFFASCPRCGGRVAINRTPEEVETIVSWREEQQKKDANTQG